MTDERSQAPSRQRREQARQQGLAPHSGTLTVAAGMLACALLLGAWGGDLGANLVELVRASTRQFQAPGQFDRFDAGWLTASIRHAFLGIVVPLSAIAFGGIAVMITAHQLQTGGVWAPGRLSPDLSQLWRLRNDDAEPESASGLLGIVLRTCRVGARVLVVALVACAVLALQWPMIQRLGQMETPCMIQAAVGVVSATWIALTLALLGLGLVELALAYRRFEQMLRTTPREQRDEQKAIDGDPAVRTRRQQLARSWLRDPGEVLAGTALVLTGKAGLTVLLAGNAPTGRVTVRTIARGIAASSLRHASERAGIPVVRAIELAGWFAVRRSRRAPLPPELAAELAALWPSSGAHTSRTD